MRRLQRLAEDERGVSSTLGFLLVAAMVIISVGVLTTAGIGVLDESRSILDTDRAESGMMTLSEESQLVASGRAESQRVSLPVDSTEQLDTHSRARITIEAQSTAVDGAVTATHVVFDSTIQTLELNTHDRNSRLAYQAGGVWAIDGRGQQAYSRVVSDPPLTISDDTTTFSIISVRASDTFVSSDGSVVLRQNDSTSLFPASRDGSAGSLASNPVGDGERIVVTIQSDYYEAWGEYALHSAGVTPAFDHANNTVRLVFSTAGGEEYFHASHTVVDVSD